MKAATKILIAVLPLVALLVGLCTSFVLKGKRSLLGVEADGLPKGTLTIKTNSTGVHLEYVAKAGSELAPLQKGKLENTCANVTVHGNRKSKLEASASDRKFTYQLKPDSCSNDGEYPVLVEIVKGGWLVHVPSLVSLGTAIEIDTKFGQTVVRGEGIPNDNGYIYIGPSKSVITTKSAYTFIGDQDSLARNSRNIDFVLEMYGKYFGSVGIRPVIVLEKRVSNGLATGQATENGFLVFPAEDQIDTHILAHELFHFWNVPPYSDKENMMGWWLVEGSAEYVAILATFAIEQSETRARVLLSRSANSCRASLRDVGFDQVMREDGFERIRMLRYSCGLFAIWLADVEIRASSEGKLNVLALIRDGFVKPNGYDRASFVQSVAMISGKNSLFSKFLEGGLDSSWSLLLPWSASVGHPIESTNTDQDFADAAIFGVMEAACPGEWSGFSRSKSGSVTLDLRPSCRNIPQSSTLSEIWGVAVGDLRQENFVEFDRKCRAGLRIPFSIKDSSVTRRVEAPCHQGLSAPEGSLSFSSNISVLAAPLFQSK
jgi:hypothetical protein